ncbi:SLBB domain-containing protein [Candidatus Omnitrophota bacterium]
MRLCGFFLVSLSIILLFAEPVKADERVGMEALRNIGNVSFESGNYRLDPDFRLGYGDKIHVNLWGKLEGSHLLKINRDGAVVIPLVGRINLFGLTIDEANAAVKREIDKKYSNVQMDLNIADVMDIRVSVLGNISIPGPISISPFSRIVEAVAKAGGPNNNGSLRDIRLIRNGKLITAFDVYDFIFKGDQRKNLRLKHGDMIYIPEVKNLVTIKGDVRYPGVYEIEDDTKVSFAVKTIDGLLPSDIKRKIYILRTNFKNNKYEVFKEIAFELTEGIGADDDIILSNGDTIIVTNIFDARPLPEKLFTQVSVMGKVKIPGTYLIKKDETLSSMLKRAGGLDENAFIEGAVFMRDSIAKKHKAAQDILIRAQERAILEEEARLAEAILTYEEKEMRVRAIEFRRRALNLMAARVPSGRIIIDCKKIIEGEADLFLEEGDSIHIPPIPDWVIITGAVYSPGSAIFEENKLFSHYLNLVGGFTKFANKEDVYVIKADGRVESKSTGYSDISRGDIIVVPEKME